jgi:hypothetical protein
MVIYEGQKQAGLLNYLGTKLYDATNTSLNFVKNQTYGRLHQDSLIKRSIDFSGKKTCFVLRKTSEYKKTVIACSVVFGTWAWIAHKEKSWNPKQWFENWNNKLQTSIDKPNQPVSQPEDTQQSPQEKFSGKLTDAIKNIQNTEDFNESKLLSITAFMQGFYKKSYALISKDVLAEDEQKQLDDDYTDINMSQSDLYIALYYEEVAKLEKNTDATQQSQNTNPLPTEENSTNPNNPADDTKSDDADSEIKQIIQQKNQITSIPTITIIPEIKKKQSSPSLKSPRAKTEAELLADAKTAAADEEDALFDAIKHLDGNLDNDNLNAFLRTAFANEYTALDNTETTQEGFKAIQAIFAAVDAQKLLDQYNASPKQKQQIPDEAQIFINDETAKVVLAKKAAKISASNAEKDLFDNLKGLDKNSYREFLLKDTELKDYLQTLFEKEYLVLSKDNATIEELKNAQTVFEKANRQTVLADCYAYNEPAQNSEEKTE